jgi:hypothetical protein
MNFACALGGSTAEMIVSAPFEMPEDPTPAMARPTMNMAEDWAAPHSAEPISKMMKKIRNDHWEHSVRLDLR